MSLNILKEALSHTTLEDLRAGLIGEGLRIPGLRGSVPLTYADYTASGRAMAQVESFVGEQVLPYYANSHTEASFCGAYMTRLRAEARNEIARITNADENHAVIFAGAGATAGINRLVSLFGLRTARQPVVFLGPYEHHSNILPWRESGAKVVEVPESPNGGADLSALVEALKAHEEADLKIGSFSAASNVTGIFTDPDPVTRVLKEHGALAVWDYAGGGPYLPIDMGRGPTRKDAVVVSPHKFPGGPGASGVLIIDRLAVSRDTPSWPGGGTVRFVSPWSEDYVRMVEAREEAGTPNVIGDIRAACAFLVKEAVGPETISAREATFQKMAMSAWRDHPHLTLLGSLTAHRLPIFSFQVRDSQGQPVHHQLFTRLLSDLFGIQARGGCACAGPYAHRLLGIDKAASDKMRAEIAAGRELGKPGWVRLNFSYLMSEDTARYIIDAVATLAGHSETWAPLYQADPATARFQPVVDAA